MSVPSFALGAIWIRAVPGEAPAVEYVTVMLPAFTV
jgi:hypothetical protein